MDYFFKDSVILIIFIFLFISIFTFDLSVIWFFPFVSWYLFFFIFIFVVDLLKIVDLFFLYFFTLDVDMLFIVFGWFYLFYIFPLTVHQMHQILFVCYWSVTFCAWFCSWFTLFKVSCKCCYWHIQVAIFTKFRLLLAVVLMLWVLQRGKRNFAILTCNLFMVFFLMLLSEVDIIHFSTITTFFDITTTITKVCGYFGFRKLSMTVITLLKVFALHFLKYYISKSSSVMKLLDGKSYRNRWGSDT